MIQTHGIFCALCFYYYYITLTCDHQAFDPRDWGPLVWGARALATSVPA